jgi:hypothetical protein
MRKTWEEIQENRTNTRMDRDYAAYVRMGKREEAAEKLVGELCREGQQVFYVWPQGGKYREGTRAELIAFLIRNNYA